MKELQLRNRQRDRTIDHRALRRIAKAFIEEVLGICDYELGVHLVTATASARLNQEFLQHDGPTDVITFDLREGYSESSGELSGEIYVCLAIAEKQAREFRTSWEEELVRYIVHGVLHLRGYDDLLPEKRRVMKREENRLLKRLGRQFDFAKIAR